MTVSIADGHSRESPLNLFLTGRVLSDVNRNLGIVCGFERIGNSS